MCALAEDIEFYTDGTLDSGDYFYGDIYNTATVHAIGGSVNWMRTHNSSTLNVDGSSLGTIYMLDSSTVNLFEGSITTITVDDNSILNVFGREFAYDDGWLSGEWGSGLSFNIHLRNTVYPSTQINLHEIPEPSSVILLALGAIALRAQKTPTRI